MYSYYYFRYKQTLKKPLNVHMRGLVKNRITDKLIPYPNNLIKQIFVFFLKKKMPKDFHSLCIRCKLKTRRK